MEQRRLSAQGLLQGELGAKTEPMKEEVGEITQTLCRQVLEKTELISDDAIKTIEDVIADIDKKLTKQVNLILHHEDFKKLEGTWRGIHYLANNTETDETLRIEFLPITKKELGKTIKKFKGTKWDQSPLFDKIYEREFGTPNGEPYGCLVGDFEFDHSPPDVEMLSGISQIASAAHAPFISAALPSLMNLESWPRGSPSMNSNVPTHTSSACWRAALS